MRPCWPRRTRVATPWAVAAEAVHSKTDAHDAPNIISVTVNGIDKSKADLINNSRTFAKSDTANPSEAMVEGADTTWIGHFGVGPTLSPVSSAPSEVGSMRDACHSASGRGGIGAGVCRSPTLAPAGSGRP